MTQLRATIVLGAALALSGACALPRRGADGGPTRADLTYAMADTAFGWIAYASDGTVRGDSARRFAAAAMWDLEGGDGARGVRLLEAAVRLGVADPAFYRDAAEVLGLLRCPSEAVALVEQSHRRWPRDPSVDSALVRATRAKARASPADQQRACPVRLRDPGTHG